MDKPSKLAYYPGCSLRATGKEYDLSTLAVCRHLGIELEELEDWNCCGATSAHNLDRKMAMALPARNVALAQQMEMDVAVPCAACFGRLCKADYYMRNDENVRREMEQIVDFQYKGNIRVLSMLEGILREMPLQAISQKVVRPLEGLQVVCYYGCLMVRPPEVRGFDDHEHPVMMDKLVEALGATALKWSYKTECCGASLGIASDVVRGPVSKLASAAKEAGAHAIVTACPLCQSNLEMRQPVGEDALPSFYFTELLGMALGLKEAESWLSKHLIDTGKAIKL